MNIDKRLREKARQRIHINNEHCKYPILQTVPKSLGWKTCNDRSPDWDVYWTDSGILYDNIN